MNILANDPDTQTTASSQGWEHPSSREALVLMDLFDLDHKVAAGKKTPKPHPGRPKKADPTTRQRGDAAGRSPAQVVALLRVGGDLSPPV